MVDAEGSQQFLELLDGKAASERNGMSHGETIQ